MEFNIGDILIGNDKVIVIAEAGVNHLGRMDYAEKLIKTAARAGADIIKFQTYKANNLSTKNAPRFWAWSGEESENGSQYDSYSKLDSFDREQYVELMKLCEKYNITFMSTPFDNESVDMLVDIGMQGFKLASCDLVNIPLVSYVAKKQLPILLSTGASTIQEIQNAVQVIEDVGNNNICIMHCTLSYPTKNEDANLAAILDIKDKFPGYVLGLSDHSLGTIIPAASVLYGVQVIEKHYTFDKTLPFSADHWLSLDEQELKTLVDHVNILKSAMGSGEKILLECEFPAHQYARRSMVTTIQINKGDVIADSMIAEKRPGTGLPPVYRDRIIGSIAKKDMDTDYLIKIDDFE